MSVGSFGLNQDTQYFEFSFDSLDTINTPNAASATTDWPQFLLGRPLTNVAAMKILEVQVPFTYYVFNSSNNTFTLTEAAGGGAVTVTIPVGNYSSTSMNAVLGTQLTAVSANGRTYTVSYSGASATQPNTGKFTITSSTAEVFTLTFGSSISPGNTNPRLWLGFGPGANASTSGGVLVAPNAGSITGPNYLYLNSRRMGQMCNMFLPQGAYNLGKGTNAPQMAKIPVNVQPNGVIYWQDPDPQKWFDLENLANFADIDFYFTMGNTSAQNPLQFNGQSFSLKLGVLVNKKANAQSLSSTAYNQRVVMRSQPR